ncbi:RNA-binding protein [Geotalea uraniireducens]|uniref:RNA-binding protein n=1 Tax=Geotalea uraniireducens TaxID=351604 RepID=A0ABN6VVU8_9BACT|nr:RNA-binding protein [Geotalea uraniireducens]BDV43757.1 RNA-binding protein [Geotalea uraniireducens]
MANELYVGNISDKATEEDLRRLFSVAGTVTSVHLITDPETGQFKRCGYVRMRSADELREAIATLDGALLINKVITVSIARPQKQQSAGKRGREGGSRPAKGRR